MGRTGDHRRSRVYRHGRRGEGLRTFRLPRTAHERLPRAPPVRRAGDRLDGRPRPRARADPAAVARRERPGTRRADRRRAGPAGAPPAGRPVPAERGGDGRRGGPLAAGAAARPAPLAGAPRPRRRLGRPRARRARAARRPARALPLPGAGCSRPAGRRSGGARARAPGDRRPSETAPRAARAGIDRGAALRAPVRPDAGARPRLRSARLLGHPRGSLRPAGRRDRRARLVRRPHPPVPDRPAAPGRRRALSRVRRPRRALPLRLRPLRGGSGRAFGRRGARPAGGPRALGRGGAGPRPGRIARGARAPRGVRRVS